MYFLVSDLNVENSYAINYLIERAVYLYLLFVPDHSWTKDKACISICLRCLEILPLTL